VALDDYDVKWVGDSDVLGYSKGLLLTIDWGGGVVDWSIMMFVVYQLN
jgi:hypothetical protein